MLGKMKIDLPENTIGFETSEDCAVIPLDDDKYLLQSVDFFTPIVDDPFIFGQIAAANSLSDISSYTRCNSFSISSLSNLCGNNSRRKATGPSERELILSLIKSKMLEECCLENIHLKHLETILSVPIMYFQLLEQQNFPQV